jgi:hypothetical protein
LLYLEVAVISQSAAGFVYFELCSKPSAAISITSDAVRSIRDRSPSDRVVQ